MRRPRQRSGDIGRARGSKAKFTAGRSNKVGSSFVSHCLEVSIARTWLPAVTTSGARLSRAVSSAPIALATPGAVWRFTSTGPPET